MTSYLSHSVAETEAFAARLAAHLRPGDVVAYRGGMGAGKTAFTRGLAAGLGVRGEISSPTFAIVNEYRGPVNLYHFDMYRVLDIDDVGPPAFLTTWSGGTASWRWSGARTWRPFSPRRPPP